jgi:hypothetical protein
MCRLSCEFSARTGSRYRSDTGATFEALLRQLTDRTNLVNPAHIGNDSLLLGLLNEKEARISCRPLRSHLPLRRGATHQLRTLSEISGSSKVIQLEDARTTLGSAALQLGRLDFDEPAVIQMVPKDLAYGRSDPEDGLIRWGLRHHNIKNQHYSFKAVVVIEPRSHSPSGQTSCLSTLASR